jgi:LAO/AO transport system kinase
MSCSALNSAGIHEIWDAVGVFADAVTSSGELAEARSSQATAWLWSEISDTLLDRFRAYPVVASLLHDAETAVAPGLQTPTHAARKLLDRFTGD